MPRKLSRKSADSKPAGRWLIHATIVLAVGAVLGFAWWLSRPRIELATYPAVIPADLMKVSGNPPDEGGKCVACHANEVADWKDSHHANANGLLNPATNLAPFRRGGVFTTNGWKTTIRSEKEFGVVTVDEPNGTHMVFHPEAMIGVTPLVQYLLPFPGGRLQTMNLAFDPRDGEWFDMQAPDSPIPDDWSHWRNRGMNWNSQCAFCHMTNLRTGYDSDSDTYRTTWDAMGISCAQCHGPMEKHAASPKDPAFFNKLSVKQMIDNCGSCHARREELTGTFHAGADFADHYRLSLPDLGGLYYPDGQIKEEDYEYGSFMMSRMGHKGISCLDCHNPHSGALKLPVENNALCLSCHTPPGQRGAIPVDVATHGHHDAGTPGSRCVDCHMPVTNYMVRDGRRDHGFTIPDPVLTKELGVPNSCNRCHDDKSADWAIENTVKWYGDKMERRSRQRARVIARVEKNDNTVLPELLAMAKSEEIAAWRSVLVSLLGPWTQQVNVRPFLEKSLTDESPLVRSAAVRDLSQDVGSEDLIKALCDDPVRIVRLDAAWGLHNARDKTNPGYDELKKYLDAICDQPAGAMRNAQFALDEHRTDDALKWSARAASWDATSGEAHQVHAMVLNIAGKQDEAMAELRRAGEVDPKNAHYPFMLALLCGEAGKTGEVIVQLKNAVAIDPAFGRAWYNLGLALAGQEQLTDSIAALRRAEELLPGTAEVPYALATLYARAGKVDEARKAAMRAQSLGYAPASQLLRQLSQ